MPLILEKCETAFCILCKVDLLMITSQLFVMKSLKILYDISSVSKSESCYSELASSISKCESCYSELFPLQGTFDIAFLPSKILVMSLKAFLRSW